MSSLTLEYVLAARAARADQQQQQLGAGAHAGSASSGAAGMGPTPGGTHNPELPEPQALLDLIKRSGAFAQLAEAVGSRLEGVGRNSGSNEAGHGSSGGENAKALAQFHARMQAELDRIFAQALEKDAASSRYGEAGTGMEDDDFSDDNDDPASVPGQPPQSGLAGVRMGRWEQQVVRDVRQDRKLRNLLADLIDAELARADDQLWAAVQASYKQQLEASSQQPPRQ